MHFNPGFTLHKQHGGPSSSPPQSGNPA
uniref:Uncharacterized protein n=1 Tax=Arundo donax TaxID=35708 RepID=A0A0A9C677_ARUDO